MEKDFIDLLELQTRLKKGVESLFPNRIWVKAEVSAVKARNGGHCYLELSQSDEKGLVSKTSAVIWSSRYRYIAPYFESVTGSPLAEGMVILVQVQVNYSELYGMSLIINDIDPEFSLGVRELERQKTIERLQSEGLMEAAIQRNHLIGTRINAANIGGERTLSQHALSTGNSQRQ